MKSTTRTIIIALVIVVIIVAAVLYSRSTTSPQTPVVQQPTVTTATPSSTATYACDAGKTIIAAYYQGESKPAVNPNMPPTPGGSVALTLSDGRTMTLAQTISADGTRYANADESFVFWGKGNGALVLENNQEKSYIGCILEGNDPSGTLSQVYTNSSAGFSLRLPSLVKSGTADGYKVDESYKYQELGPGKDIAGTKFTIPASLAAGTNLSTDSYISVEELPNTALCTADLFVEKGLGAKATTLTDNGVTYSMATTSGAGAGNRYNETVYAIPGTNPCMAVRYYIHYGAYANYDPKTTKQFDEDALKASFDQIRRTLVVNQ